MVDFVTWELYNWWLQLMKLNYTEIHYVKPLGFGKADKIIELLQDDIEEGVDVKVLPGQVVSEDRIFKQERAMEEYTSGLISPLDYHQQVSKEDPEGVTKRLIMFKMNPASLITLSEEDQTQLQTFQGKNVETIQNADAMTQIQQFLQSDEFQSASPEEQQEMIDRIRSKTQQIKQTT